jgi:hypothetical protein
MVEAHFVDGSGHVGRVDVDHGVGIFVASDGGAADDDGDEPDEDESDVTHFETPSVIGNSC